MGAAPQLPHSPTGRCMHSGWRDSRAVMGKAIGCCWKKKLVVDCSFCPEEGTTGGLCATRNACEHLGLPGLLLGWLAIIPYCCPGAVPGGMIRALICWWKDLIMQKVWVIDLWVPLIKDWQSRRKKNLKNHVLSYVNAGYWRTLLSHADSRGDSRQTSRVSRQKMAL